MTSPSGSASTTSPDPGRRDRPGARERRLADGAALAYDELLVASGSRLHAPIEGAELPGVHDFKSLRQPRHRGRVRRRRGDQRLIVGAGFIGMEIALLLADLGRARSRSSAGAAGSCRGCSTRRPPRSPGGMAARGIELRLGVEATASRTRRAGRRRPAAADGELVTADLYVAATGVKPNLGFLAGSGHRGRLGHHGGRSLRTNGPEIWAAGDVVEAPDRATGKAFVHAIFPNAVDQARVVADEHPRWRHGLPGAESMNSLKHLGLPIMAVGAMEGPDELRWRDGDVLRKVFLDDGRIVGFRFTGEIAGGGLLRSLLLRGDDVRRFGRRLVLPGFGVSEIVLPAMAL